MRLAAGTRLGPYEVAALIGAGGMGEVYRARDTRLQRDVAVKVLPTEYSRDPERLRRFEQEARAAGSLNHPNILTIHDIGVHEGSPYVVSELLEGETLRVRLDSPLPPRKAVEYALGIARGLAAAHDKGIVHRDLKPENLFITRNGWVKILDFGLAKLTQREAPSGQQSDSGTLTADTDPGRVLGTPGYMSPEQVRGREVDHRADIFTFGAILYEMLTGRRAFTGESSVEALHAILNQEPPELPPAARLAPGLDRIVRRCLEKRPEDRFQSTRDLAFYLESATAESSSPVLAPPPRRSRRTPVALGVVAILLVVAAFLGGRFLGQRTGRPAPTFQPLTFRFSVITAARFAPDGETILYSASYDGQPVQVYTTRVGGMGSRSLGLPPAGLWAISPAGELAVSLGCTLNWAECIGTLARVPLTGGAPRPVLGDVLGADWSPDGQSMVVVRGEEGQYRLEYPPGQVLYQTGGWITYPRVSPRGDWIAFIEHPKLGEGGGSVKAVHVASKQKRDLSVNWTNLFGLAWRPDNEEIWFSGGQGTVRNSVYGVSLTSGVRLVYDAPGSLRLLDISPQGRVLLNLLNARGHVFFQASGAAEERELSWLDWVTAADLSADGKTLLFYEWGAGVAARPTIYLRQTDGSEPIRLGEGKPLALSPDGKMALAVANSTPPHLVLLPTGPGEPRQLPRGAVEEFWWATWFPDGRRILFAGNESDLRPRSYVQNVEAGEPKRVLRDGLAASLVSPDGKRVVAQNMLDGSYSVWPLDGGEPERIPGMQPEEELLAWAADGRSFWLRSRDPRVIKLFQLDAATGRRALAREIAPPATGMIGFAPDPGGVRITPNGKAWVYSYWRVLHELYVADGLR